MSARTIRRAAERRAQKLAAKAARLSQSANAASPEPSVVIPAVEPQPTVAAEQQPAPETESKPPISEARVEANRANAQKSHGPVTDAGKAKTRLNAVKHGLTGATVLFANLEDAQRYSKLASEFEQLYQPLGPEECALVQSIIDTRWRIGTAPLLEFAIIARATATLIDGNPDFWNQPGKQADLFLEVRRQNEKELRNLQLQEHRLSRRCERETTKLLRLQAERKANEEYKLAEAAKAVLLAEHRNPEDDAVSVPGLGFDFSKQRFQIYLRRLAPAQKQSFLQQALSEAGETTKTTRAAA